MSVEVWLKRKNVGINVLDDFYKKYIQIYVSLFANKKN